MARKLLLATTTSVQDSGLLDDLIPGFRERTGIAVQVVAVGSGAALRMGAEGNADVIVSHDPKGEQEWSRRARRSGARRSWRTTS